MATKQKVDYGRYLASREWRLRRKEVMEITDGWCYRCWSEKIRDVHHLTYERLGNEGAADLQGLCHSCHEYISGETDKDPAEAVILRLLGQGLEPGPLEHFGFRAWWETKPLANGHRWSIDFKSSPDVDAESRPSTLVFAAGRGVWVHCWWC